MADSVFSDIPASSGRLVFGAEGDSLPPASQLIFEDRPAVYGNLVFGTESDGAIEDATLKIASSVGELGGSVTIACPRRIANLAASGKVGDLAGAIRITAKPPAARLAVGGNVGDLAGGVKITARPPAARLAIAGQVGDLAGSVKLAVRPPSASVRVSGNVGELSGMGQVLYSSNTERPDAFEWRTAFSQGSAVDHATVSHYRDGPRLQTPLQAVWQDAQALHRPAVSPWREGLRSQTPVASGYEEAVQVTAWRATGFRDGARLQRRVCSLYEEAAFASVQRTSGFQEAYGERISTVSRYQEALRLAMQAGARFAQGLPLRWRHESPYQDAMRPPGGERTLPAPIAPSSCYVPSAALVFSEEWSSSAELVFICERHSTQPPAALVIIPKRKAYVTVNSITLRRVSDSAPITAYGFGMSLDWRSWTWSWSASIPVDQLVLLRGTTGYPVEVEALVNGIPFRLCAEGPDRQRQFAKGRAGIKGRGTAAVLDTPYAPVLNFGNAAPRTAQQLMLDALTINGVSIGWAVDWGLTDWLVPGNAWSHQGTYISAVLDIASAAGGYVQPHDTEQTLRILPRYPVAPWDWAGVTPDIELPGIATDEGIEWQRKADYNSIHLSGLGAGGVLRQVKRAGTAGDIEAPMITHPLFTHSDAARQRGLAELSDTGMQAPVNVKLPVLQETGLILPGKFVRYTSDNETHIGLTRSISLDWSFPVLRQTLSIETHPVEGYP